MLKLHILFFALVATCCALPTSAQEPIPENPLKFGNTRFTFITPTLFRVEYAYNGEFVDAQTMFAYDRSQLDSHVTIQSLGDNRYEIRTSAVRLLFFDDGYPGGTFNLQVFYNKDGKEQKLRSRGNPKDNLGGTISTLDLVRGEVPTEEGLLSRVGWYIIDDTGRDLIVDEQIVPRSANHVSDQYYFVYGGDYKAALASLGAISGKVPMTRKYMHGIWYCRYWSYTDKEFVEIIDEYDKRDFPIDNLVFDMGWHLQDEATIGAGDAITRGWTGYTWAQKYIPSPEKLIAEVHRRGLTVSLNDHPHDGLRPHDAAYPEFLASIKREKPSLITRDTVVIPNFGDKVYLKNFFQYALGPSEDKGVDFWWLDWQQNYLYPNLFGTKTSTLSWLNKRYYEHSVRDGLRGASYSRWAGWGDHRYPIQFSGDAFSSWPVLKFEVKLSCISGNAGCFYWAHDIGGFYGSDDPELFARWSQFGALSASLKVHAMKDPNLDRRPWIWGKMAEQSIRKAYHLRAEIFPYIYTSVWTTHSTMVPLTRPMYIDFGADDASYENPQEYMFGDLMLAAPITDPGKGEMRVASQKLWFPKGEVWYDWFSAERHEGGTEALVSKNIDEFPVFVKGGWLLPMQPYTSRPAM
ncbi:MAG: glycoside hydrolase family 31 protein, partial [Alistipes sp.]